MSNETSILSRKNSFFLLQKIENMEIETFNGYIPNYPITLSSSADHGNIYSLQSNYNYQYSSTVQNGDNLLVWSNAESYINQSSDLSSNISSPTSFYSFQNQTLNSDDPQQQHQVIDNCTVVVVAKNKRGRKKGCGKKNEKVKMMRRSKKRSESSPASPTVMKKRRLAANARERRRMNGLNTAFDR